MKKQLVTDIIASLFILLFLYTGLIKIFYHARFDWALNESPLLRGGIAALLSWLIPAVEIGLVTLLLLPRTRTKGLFGSTFLIGIFSIYVGFMLYFRSDRPCTCGGIIEYMTWHQHFYFNTGFTLLGAISIWLDKQVRAAEKKNINLAGYPS